jgi:hypothetical protein
MGSEYEAKAMLANWSFGKGLKTAGASGMRCCGKPVECGRKGMLKQEAEKLRYTSPIE